jgi:hypothetical protein
MRVPVVSLMSATRWTGTPWARSSATPAEASPSATHVFLEALLEHGDDVVSLDAGRAEALGPPEEDAVVDALLDTGIAVRASAPRRPGEPARARHT